MDQRGSGRQVSPRTTAPLWCRPLALWSLPQCGWFTLAVLPHGHKLLARSLARFGLRCLLFHHFCSFFFFCPRYAHRLTCNTDFTDLFPQSDLAEASRCFRHRAAKKSKDLERKKNKGEKKSQRIFDFHGLPYCFPMEIYDINHKRAIKTLLV